MPAALEPVPRGADVIQGDGVVLAGSDILRLNAGAVGLSYIYDNPTADADPGLGRLRLNSAVGTTVTQIFVDDADALGGDPTATLVAVGVTTYDVAGHVRIWRRGDPSKWMIFNITSTTGTASTYKKLQVAFVAASDAGVAIPFLDEDELILSFVFGQNVLASGGSGTQGTQGIPGVPGRPGEPGRTIVGAQGSQGPSGIPGATVPGRQGADGRAGMPGRQGIDGAPGATGATGVSGVIGPPGRSVEPERPRVIPGQRGNDGATGADGTAGIGTPGVPGRTIEPERPRIIPGAAGAAGAAGATGAAGAAGAIGPPSRVIEPERPRMIPGPAGAVGAVGPAGIAPTGVVAVTAVNFGSTPRLSGSFDISGLSGLTANTRIQMFHAVDLAHPDESEEQILVTGYALNSTTIRGYWKSESFFSGVRDIGYMIGSSVVVGANIIQGAGFGNGGSDTILISVAGPDLTFDFVDQGTNELLCTAGVSTTPVFRQIGAMLSLWLIPGPAPTTPFYGTEEGNGIILEANQGSVQIGVRGWDRRIPGIKDEFFRVPTTTADGTVATGDWVWFFNLLAGTVTLSSLGTAITHHPGIARFALSANSTCSFVAGISDTDPLCTFQNFGRVDCIVRVVTALAGAFFQFGISSTTNDMRTAANAAWFEFNQATDTSMHARTRDNGVDTEDQDLGSSADVVLDEWYVLSIRKNASNDIEFYIDDLLETTVLAATHAIDAADQLTFGWFFDTSVAGAVGFDIDLVLFPLDQLSDRT